MRIKDVIGYIRKADEISIVMGAGASRTAGVPTAPSLVEQINKEFDHCLIGLSADERKDYGRVMGALSPGDRKSLIEPLLAHKLGPHRPRLHYQIDQCTSCADVQLRPRSGEIRVAFRHAPASV